MLGHALVGAWNNKWNVYATATRCFPCKCTEFRAMSFETESFSGLNFSKDPDVIINCAAITDHSLCAAHPEMAYKINTLAPLKLAQRFPKAYFIQVSTDAVFGNECTFPDEDAPANPQTVYGRTKLAGENLLLGATRCLILRTTIVGFGGRRKTPSLANWVVNSLQQKLHIGLYTDVLFTPVSVPDFISLLEWSIAQRPSGVLHACGPETISKYDFGMQLARTLNLDCSYIGKSLLAENETGTGKRFNQSLDSSRLSALYGHKLPGLMGCVHSLANSF